MTEQVHLDRKRAESFGAVAELCDRHRPGYPGELIDDLAALRPAQVLDVGCGTGHVARALARKGLAVLGVEPDAQMAAVARRHGARVEVATFEAWNDAGRTFDLVTCGAAWHWVDPELGIQKAARLLRPGGTLARFWNYEVPDDAAKAAVEAVYAELAPKATRYVSPPSLTWADPAGAGDCFSPLEIKIYDWTRTLSTEQWVGMVTTFSDHRRMEPERLAALQRALTDAIDALGGRVRARCGTFVGLAQRLS